MRIEIEVPRSKHSTTQPYKMLRPGENGAQLWERLPVRSSAFGIDGPGESQVYNWTKLTGGTPARAMVMVMEPDGPYVWAAMFKGWVNPGRTRDGARVPGKTAMIEVM